MSEVKLKPTGGGAGSVSLKAPAATTGNADVPFILPVADGSAGQYLKTDGSKNLSFATVAGGDTNTPGFQAYKNDAINVAMTAYTELVISNELWDSGSAYDTSNGRFTPQTAGTYLIYFSCVPWMGSDTVNMMAQIRKNGGTAYNTGSITNDITWDGTEAMVLHAQGIFTLNGSSDYVSPWVYLHNYSDQSTQRRVDQSYFGGFRITAAY